MDNKKEILVSAIDNGTVIDHVPTDSLYQVIRILGLERYNDEVLMGNYLASGKLGRKGIVKIRNKHFSVDEVNKIALVAPSPLSSTSRTTRWCANTKLKFPTISTTASAAPTPSASPTPKLCLHASMLSTRRT